MWIIVVSFGLAAIGGITVLLGGSLGEPAGKVLATTAIVGAFSVAVLCCASLLGRRLRAFGIAGVVISLATLAWSLVMLWGADGLSFDEVMWKLLGTGIALTAASALEVAIVEFDHYDGDLFDAVEQSRVYLDQRGQLDTKAGL